MSLDVYLELDESVKARSGSGIFVRENGATVEISREEWDSKFPGREPVIAISDDGESRTVYSANITHNLGRMAKEAGIYEELWRPEEIAIEKAWQLIVPLRNGISLMKSDPVRFNDFDAENGWGTYRQFVPWIERYLAACENNPNALVRVSR